MKEFSIRVRKVANGWVVERSWEEEAIGGEDKYKEEEFIFFTIDEVLEKVKESLALEN